MSFSAIIDADQFILNGRALRDAEPVQAFHELLGRPTRIEPAGQPAPVGHRNNQIHLYDNLGLYLIEHHFTFLVDAVTFVFWREEAAFATERDFTGDLRVGHIDVKPGMMESDMRGTTIPFVSQLTGSWSFKSDDLWVGIDTKGEKRSTGRRSKRRRIVSVSVCLKHDPWDTRFRPGSAVVN